MAQNTERGMMGDLTIRDSPEHPINADDASKLARALDLARRAVPRAAVEALDAVSAASAVLVRPGSSGHPMISQQEARRNADSHAS